MSKDHIFFSLSQRIERHWYASKKTWFACALMPFAFLFSLMARVRRFLYQRGWLKCYRAPCPVVIVGNISVGGVGKTPLVIALYFFLKERGWEPGIISRGYKGKYRGVEWVASDSDPLRVGDEAVLLASRTGGPVVVSRNRSHAIETLVQETACNIILSDDGLQHYAIARDLEIVVIDAVRGLGNQLCLPAGPLREPVARLKSVDMVVVNGGREDECAFSLSSTHILNLLNSNISQSQKILYQCKVHAFAGIGSPKRFFDYLRGLGAEVVEHPYPDHYLFQKRDFENYSEASMLIMTEKDAVKCRQFAGNNMWFIPVEAHLNRLFLDKLKKFCETMGGSDK